MLKKRKSARRTVSAVGLALMAVLAWGAIAAGSAQASSWHISNVPLSGSATFATDDESFQITIPTYGNAIFNCTETSEGNEISAGSNLKTTLIIDCALKGSEVKCDVKPMKIPYEGSATSLTPKNKYTMMETPGPGCSWPALVELVTPGLTVSYGAPGVKLSATTSGTTSYGEHPVYFNGKSSWSLTGAQLNKKWGYGELGLKLSFGSAGSGNGQFTAPRGLARDAAGNVYVADSGNNRIQKFSSSGAYVSQFGVKGTGNGQFEEPTSVAVDSSGNLWVVDRKNNRVQKFNAAGEYVSQFGTKGSADGQLKEPYGLAIDSGGNLWISDRGNERIQKFNSSGGYVSQFAAMSWGLAVDSSGNVWTANGTLFRKFSSSGVELGQYGGPGVLTFAVGIALDSVGNVVVTDNLGKRVRRFLGNGELIGDVVTGWAQPTEVTVDPATDDIWILSLNSSVRKYGF